MLILQTLLAALLLQQVYSPAEFTQVQGASLKARFDSALVQANRANDDTFWVAYRFPVRPGIRISTSENNTSIQSLTTSDGIEWIPAETEVQRVGIFLLVGKSDGAIQKTRLINLNQNFRVHDRRVYWLGEANAEDSVSLLSNLTLNSPQNYSSSLIHYMTLHDSPGVTTRLLQMARDTSNNLEMRRNAISYLGREVNQQAAQELEKLTSDTNSEIQKAAVQAISRRVDNESVPALIRIAKDHPNQTVKRQAIQLLGQKKDPRVVDFFEQMLKKK